MFVAVNSVEQRNNPNNDDVSPADFTALFDSPIVMHHANLELVSSVIRRDTSAIVVAGQNSILVRIGEPETSNQFEAVVEPGSYSITALADAVAQALNDATPIPQYRTFTCTVNASDQLVITHGGIEPLPAENAQTFATTPVNNGNMVTDPPVIPFRSELPAFGGTGMDQVSGYFNNYFGGVANSPYLINAPIEADGTPFSMDKAPQTFYTFENTAVHPNNGEIKLSIPMQRGYNVSTIDGTFGTSQAANIFKYYPNVGDPFGAIFGLPTADFDASPPMYFKIKTVASTAGGVTEASRNQYLIECAPEDVDSNGAIIRKNFAMRINASGVMTIDCTVRDSLLRPIGKESEESVHLMGNYHYVSGVWKRRDVPGGPQNDDPLPVARFDGFQVDKTGTRSYLYTANDCCLRGWDAEATPTSGGGASVRYKTGSVGIINSFGSNGQPIASKTSDFKRRAATYKVTAVTADRRIAKYILLSPGEGYDATAPLLFDDRTTIYGGGKTSEATIVANCGQDTLSASDLSTNYFALGGDVTRNGLFIQEAYTYPYAAIGIVSKTEADDPTSNIGKGSTPDNCTFWIEMHPEYQGNASPFSVTVKQTIKNSTFMNDRTTVTLLDRVTPNSWNSILYTGPNPAPANWSQFTPGNTVELSIVQRDVYNIDVRIGHKMQGSPGPPQEQVSLVRTGDIIDGVTVLQTARDSEMPYIPILKMSPLNLTNDSRYEFNGNFVPVRSTPALVAAGVFDKSWPDVYPSIGPITARVDDLRATPIANYSAPRVCLKTRPVNASQIADPPAATGQIATVDFDPPTTAQFGAVAGLHTAYFLAPGTATRTMTAHSPPPSMSFVGSYSIEMPNLPLKGWVGKGYDLAGNKVGHGQRGSILHVIPADENVTFTSLLQVYDYRAAYPMPVHACLDAPTPFQSLQFRLRNIETGELLRDLRHPTQIIFRVIPKDPKMYEKNNRDYQ